ncbi:hypothetical protein TrVE_jg7549 [Triparma verrucosa]|uniref:Peroxisomal membrane protein PEX16 n=1 Tax=Triparma verrucosa TaxID=1606542 RepID=A0A9W7BPN6_9STRA|nr:hypothetical protein TrVE_jg7549 [Triparma verrucosa]
MISNVPIVSWVKSHVQSHATSLSLLSSLISSLSYLLPNRYSNSDSTVELTCAISDLISLLTDLCKYEEVKSTGMTINTTINTTVNTSNTTNKTQISMRILLAVIEIIQLSVEKVCRGKDEAWGRNSIVSIEAFKSVLRLLILKGNFQGNFHRQGLDDRPVEASILEGGGKIVPGYRNPTEEEVYVEGLIRRGGVKVKGSKTGREIRLPVEAVRRGEWKDGENDIGRSDTNSTAANPTSNATDKNKNIYLILGEVLHVLRPTIYAQLNYKTYTSPSWVPWLTSLTLDVLSHKLTTLGLKSSSPTSSISPPNASELRRRKNTWFLYVLRAPIFKRGVGKIVNLRDYVSLPGFEMVFRYVIGWLVYVKRNHFLLESMG